jgi:hypothetical protein
MPNCTSRNSGTRLPLWRAERLRLYRRRFPGPGRRLLEVRLSNQRINGLAKRGYLGPNELDNERAISQALRLFLWDTLIGDRRQTATKTAKRLGGDPKQCVKLRDDQTGAVVIWPHWSG